MDWLKPCAVGSDTSNNKKPLYESRGAILVALDTLFLCLAKL